MTIGTEELAWLVDFASLIVLLRIHTGSRLQSVKALLPPRNSGEIQ